MDYGWITQWGSTVECMAISPVKPDWVVVGTAGHVFLTDNAGSTWQQRYCRIEGDRFRGNGLEVTCFNDIVPDPKEPGRLYFCYFDIGLLVSNDCGRTFQKAVDGMKHSGNCFTVVVDPADTNVLWAGTGEWASNQGDVCRSKDRGRTWTVVGKPESGLPAGQTKHLVLDPTSPPDRRILYVTSTGNGIFRSGDGGTHGGRSAQGSLRLLGESRADFYWVRATRNTFASLWAGARRRAAASMKLEMAANPGERPTAMESSPIFKTFRPTRTISRSSMPASVSTSTVLQSRRSSCPADSSRAATAG